MLLYYVFLFSFFCPTVPINSKVHLRIVWWGILNLSNSEGRIATWCWERPFYCFASNTGLTRQCIQYCDTVSTLHIAGVAGIDVDQLLKNYYKRKCVPSNVACLSPCRCLSPCCAVCDCSKIIPYHIYKFFDAFHWKIHEPCFQPADCLKFY